MNLRPDETRCPSQRAPKKLSRVKKRKNIRTAASACAPDSREPGMNITPGTQGPLRLEVSQVSKVQRDSWWYAAEGTPLQTLQQPTQVDLTAPCELEGGNIAFSRHGAELRQYARIMAGPGRSDHGDRDGFPSSSTTWCSAGRSARKFQNQVRRKTLRSIGNGSILAWPKGLAG